MHTPQSADPEPVEQKLASSPHLDFFRTSRLLSLVIIVPALGVTILYIALYGLQFGNMLSPVTPLFLVLMFSFQLCIYSIQFRYETRIEHERSATFLRNAAARFKPLPAPDLDYLQVPLTIHIGSVTWQRMVVLFIWPMLILLAGYLYFMEIQLFHLTLPWFWLLLINFSFMILLLFGFVLGNCKRRRPVEFTQDGMRFLAESTRKTSFMPWHEACFFACYAEPGPWRDSPTTVFELSSASQVVYWTYTRPAGGLFNALTRLFFPIERDRVPAQVVWELITQKTGLPLHNLSAGRTLDPEHFSG